MTEAVKAASASISLRVAIFQHEKFILVKFLTKTNKHNMDAAITESLIFVKLWPANVHFSLRALINSI